MTQRQSITVKLDRMIDRLWVTRDKRVFYHITERGLHALEEPTSKRHIADMVARYNERQPAHARRDAGDHRGRRSGI